jgi:CHAT domain-containing protein
MNNIARGPQLWRFLIAAVVAITICLLIAVKVFDRRGSAPPHQQLISATEQWRPADGRLTGGFRWRPRQKATIIAQPDGDKTLVRRAAAATVLQQVNGRTDPDALRLMAASHLVLGQTSAAIANLEHASRLHTTNASVWSDFATARLVLSIEKREQAGLPLALAAADHAIALDPELAEARFNRAAILERLGLRDQSRAEWSEYLRRDQSSEWAGEGRRRLHQLKVDPEWKPALGRALEAHATGDTEQIAGFVTTYPQEARSTAEGLLFYQWAEAETARDSYVADRIFEQIEIIGSLLAKRGEFFLVDAISTAKRARLDPQQKKTLVAAYRLYGQGRMKLSNGSLHPAEEMLRQSSTLFRLAGSPMAIVSEYFTANAIFDQNRIEEARDILTHLVASVDRSRHPALTAQIQWQLARCDSYEGAWSSCMARVRDAHVLFERQGETTNRSFVDAILAETYDRMALVEEGWAYRVSAFDALSRLTDRSRLAAVLGGAIRAEIYRHQYDSALALAKIAIEESAKGGAQTLPLVAEAHTRRVIVLARANATNQAMEGLVNARLAAGRIEDKGLRQRATADIDFVEASIIRSSDPARAVDLLTGAIAFYARQKHKAWLPAAWLERGLAFQAADESERALNDFEQGIREIERQRSGIDQNELRSAFFDTAPDLFSNAIELLMARGEIEAAYAVAERARARTLYEQLGTSASLPRTNDIHEIQKRLGDDAVIVEYQLLPAGLAIFCLDRRSLTAVRTNTDAAALRKITAALVTSVRTGRTAAGRKAAADAWQLLLAPVANRIDGARRLIIVPDRFLHAIPFPALFDVRTNEYIIEKHELVLSPSGSFAGVVAQPLQTTPALIVGNPTDEAGTQPRLPRAEAEARKIARLHRANVLLGDDATRTAILAAAAESALIHYAGHALSADDRNENQLVLAGRGGERLLHASEIARLPLTRTSIVVLAACGTLRGNTERVEGIPSLARAFMAAGVPTVVGTLWDIPDESSAPLFLAFHQRLRQGLNPAAALRDAQIAQIRRSTRPDDMTWATIAIIGRG